MEIAMLRSSRPGGELLVRLRQRGGRLDCDKQFGLWWEEMDRTEDVSITWAWSGILFGDVS